MEDPRRETKNKSHYFIDIIVIALCGAICGANNWTSIAAYGRAKEDWFRTFLTLQDGIPSHDTFNDILDILNYLAKVSCKREIFFLWRSYLKDPKDDLVLEVAVESESKVIVSYNKKDFVGGNKFGIKVFTPKEFLEKRGLL